MNLRFEIWAREQLIGEEAKDLASEAATCFRAGAYRASLLLSYLAFQTVIRERLKRATAPAGFRDEQWTAYQRRYHNEDQWDAAVFDATQQQNPPIFFLSQDIREEVKYWKNRRNDCAHAKDGRIGQAHVEALWLFIESRLARFVVNGSRQELTNRVARHFDRSITPPHADVLDVARDFPRCIENTDVADVLEEIEQIFHENNDFLLPNGQDFASFVICAYEASPPPMRSQILSFLAVNLGRFRYILEQSAVLVADLRGQSDLVRRLWYGDTTVGPASLGLLCALLAQGVVPAGEVPEALSRIMPKVRDADVPDERRTLLRMSGFDDAFRTYAFLQQKIDRFGWANVNSKNVIDYLSRHTIDEEVAGALQRTFSITNHPSVLAADLQSFFASNTAKRVELEGMLAQTGASWPQYL